MWMRDLRRRLSVGVVMTSCGMAAIVAPASIAAMPENDDFANAIDLGSGDFVRASGTNLWATAERNEPDQGGGAPAKTSVWYRWTAPRDGVVRAKTCASSFDTTLGIFRGSELGALGRVASNNDRCGDKAATRFFAVTGTTYQIAIDGFERSMGAVEFKLLYLAPPANDDFANALDLGTGMSASQAVNTRDATIEPRERRHHPGVGTIASVWYRWTAPDDIIVVIDTCKSDFDTILSVYEGSNLNDLERVQSDDDSCRGEGSVVRIPARAGVTYSIAVAGYGLAIGNVRLRLVAVAPPAT